MKKRNQRRKKARGNEAIIVKRPWYCFGSILFPLIIEAVAVFLLLSGIKVEGIQFMYAEMIIAAIALVWIIVDFFCWRLMYIDGQFLFRTWYGKHKVYKGTELKQILEYYSWPQRRMALVLYFADGKKIAINEAYRGYQEFHSFLKRNHYPIKTVE